MSARAERSGPDRLALAALAAALLVVHGSLTRHGPALADEYVYLAGARHFAETGRLDARFYDAEAILARGHPHQDVHSPGYAMLLGALTALFGGAYWTAVALNVAAYLAGALLVHALTGALGFSRRGALLAGGLYLILPAYLPFVFWVMPEVVLGTLFLAALLLAVRWGDRWAAAILAALTLALGILVRETLVFGLPPVVVALRDRAKRMAFLAVLGLMVLLVHGPLSRDRAPGGVNFWTRPTQTKMGFEAVHAARAGDLTGAVAGAWSRVWSNVRRAPSMGLTEKTILALFAMLPLLAVLGDRSNGVSRRCLPALSLGLLALYATLLAIFVIGRWSGFRYLMFFAPAFLPWIARAADGPGSGVRRWALPGGVAVACLLIAASVTIIHNQYKASRQRRWEAIASYVERYVAGRRVARIVLPDGWAFGLRHYPVEVVSSLPVGGGRLRLLEQTLWFDYLVLPGDSPLGDEWDGRNRYLRVNRDQDQPPLKVYRRLR